MINGKSVLAIIPARGGSKSLPGKNKIEVGGRPLIAWSINAAAKSQYIDCTVVSSDDPEIITIAKLTGENIPLVRPAHLATDDATLEDTTLHVLDNLDQKYDLLVLLQPTSPLRTGQDIDACLELCINRRVLSAVTVAETPKSPHWMFTLQADGNMDRILPYSEEGKRRQNLPIVYSLNGAVYVVDIKHFQDSQNFIDKETIASIMPPERSIDIDTPLDLIVFKALLAEKLVYETHTK